ncbi:MAG: 50S ribosomal protein L18 [Clostridiales bacterium]|nr:50S ribosomal protein L18 [Clostridiales bacterium]
MIKKEGSNISRKRRQARVRKKVSGTAGVPRLNVFRSLKNITAQVIDDEKGATIASASTMEKDFRAKTKNGGNKAAALAIGELVAKRAKQAGITEVVFDRGGYLYHGRVEQVAEGARKGGLEF